MNLVPFLLFDGSCADAMHFYRACLGGDLSITTVEQTALRDAMPPEQHAKVVHAKLRSGFVELAATDWLHPTRIPTIGNTVALYLETASQAELEGVFDRLADGADPDLLDDVREAPFGVYGHLADKFGVHWFFHAQP